MRISILLVILSVAVYAQGFNFSVGYTGFNLSQQKAEFENVVKTFNSLNQGLHVPIQKNYPNNVFLGFSFTWDVASDIFMDLNMVLARTNAYALY
ncbi:MAG: hypothetical protein HYV28_21150, partial [Ignavibacteriales bacterium]|nr:hypothetical protein [Ignavibacteriales bacterium]